MGTKQTGIMKSVVAFCLLAAVSAVDLSELCASIKVMDHADPVHMAAARLCKESSYDVALLQVGDDDKKLPNGTLVVGDLPIDGTTNTISTKENDLVLSPATGKKIVIDAWTRLGAEAPPFAMKQIQLYMPTQPGESEARPHGLQVDKIISVNVVVYAKKDGGGVIHSKNNPTDDRSNYMWWIDSGNVNIHRAGTNTMPDFDNALVKFTVMYTA